MTGVLRRRGRHMTGEDHVMTKAETEVDAAASQRIADKPPEVRKG